MTHHRRTLAELRGEILQLVGDTWVTPHELQRALGIGGHGWYRVALVCERLAHEGVLELRNPRSRGKRWFRKGHPAQRFHTNSVVIPDLDALSARLAFVEQRLAELERREGATS